MTDSQIIALLAKSHYGSHTALAMALQITLPALSNWKAHNIPAAWRPTIWALFEQRCPDVASELDRDTFLGVRLPPSETEGAA